ncbi:MAG: bifunctional 4-hydroxy-3-methylbut-2-enyl diphosphate reductase/30S ribosomal protein S1, partial [Candidatus Omnitrophota bacterium]
MKFNLAKSAGFCFGVKRALNIAFDTLKTTRDIEMLGDIVHNEEVVRMIEKTGIRKIKKLKDGKNKTLLIRAHGASKATIKKAKKSNYNVVDATCPMVKEIHTIVCDMEKKGYKIIIIGDRNHDEVRGIIGQLNCKPLIIETIKDIRATTFRQIK